MHGPTYMANPLACAAANASLDLFDREPRKQQVINIEAHLEEHLGRAKNIQGVVDVRVKGAIGVIQLDGPMHLDWMRVQFLKRGVWIRPFRDIVYLTPALTIEDEDLQFLTRTMLEVVEEWSVMVQRK